MNVSSLRAVLFSVALCAWCQARPGDFVWIEAEKPAEANFKFDGDTRQSSIFSKGKCFFYTVRKADLGKVPPEGLLLSYNFAGPASGTYRFWARLGMEWVRAPMDWRIDSGAWQTYSSKELTTNLMQVAVWNEIAWGDCGTVQLGPGKHRLDIRFQTPHKDKILLGLDCFAFTAPSWIPEGRLQPGETYTDEASRKAGEYTFTFPASLLKQPSGKRLELDLSGPWQVARYDDLNMDANTLEPVRTLPESSPLRWMGARVPGDVWPQRPELPFAHRLVYQTRIDIPSRLEGRSFVLHFAGTCYLASVFVNGQFCGARQSVLVPWDCDLTSAIQPGKVNVVRVAIKSSYYTLDPGRNRNGTAKSVHERRNLPHTHRRYARWTDAVYPSSKGEGNGMQVGIVNPCKLVVAGPAYTSDVIIRTGVAGKTISVSVEVTNTSGEGQTVDIRCQAVNDRTGRVEKELARPKIILAPRSRGSIAIDKISWPEAKLWWPSEKMGDLPALYRLRTTLSINGRPADLCEDSFGFREITIRGRDFLLNGVPWRFYNWVDVPHAKKIKDPQEWLRLYHKQNDGFHRFSWDHSHIFGYREKAIEALDRFGIPNRCSMCIDGMFITQDLLNPLVWKNWERHVRQVVRAYRNHPSIMHWSIGNEVMLVNAHNTRRRQYLELEKKMARLIEAANEEDPTRPSYEDGAGDLGGQGPVNCVHYSWKYWPDIPRQLYDIPKGKAEKRPNQRRDTYMWSGKDPYIGGEVFYYPGRPNWIAWFGGPRVYRSQHEADLAAGRYARMGLEAHRWQNVAGQCPWTTVKPGGSEKALARKAVFVREYNQCFFSGADFTRTIKVFNDSRSSGNFTFAWEIVFGEQTAAQGTKKFLLAPGMNQPDIIRAKLPRFQERRNGELRLQLESDGRIVFEDNKPVCVLPKARTPVIPNGMLKVFDPGGGIVQWLNARKIPYRKAESPAQIGTSAQAVLVGPQALTPRNKKVWADALQKAVLAGKTAIVLEQSTPLEKSDLPVASIELGRPGRKQRVRMAEFVRQGGQFGSICHPVALAHPVLVGLESGDFFCWAGKSENNYRLSYASPPGGAIPLIKAGDELKMAPMLEVPVGGGSYLLSQILIGQELGADPAAEYLLANLLEWAKNRTAHPPKPAVVVANGDPGFLAFLKSTGLDFSLVPSAEVLFSNLRGPGIIRASRKDLSWMTENAETVRKTCQSGKWVMMTGLDGKGISSLNQLVGVEQRIRRFRAEAVRLQAPEDPLVMGLTDSDFAQRGYKMIAPWMKLYKTSDQIFTRVVDASPDIASFARGASPKLTDGNTVNVFWRYTEYYPSDGSQPIHFEWDHPETLTGMQIWTSGAYFRPKDIRVFLDDDQAHPLAFVLEDHDQRQDFAWPPRKARRLTIQMLSHHPADSKKPLVTFDEIRIFRTLPSGLEKKVKAFTTPAGIVKYPLRLGGLVLNCLNWNERPGQARNKREAKTIEDIMQQNLQKKRSIMSSLLRNMGAAFKPISTPAK